MKKVCLICAAVLVCGSLVACGNQSAKSKNSSSEISSLKKENSRLKDKKISHHKHRKNISKNFTNKAASKTNSINNHSNEGNSRNKKNKYSSSNNSTSISSQQNNNTSTQQQSGSNGQSNFNGPYTINGGVDHGNDTGTTAGTLNEQAADAFNYDIQMPVKENHFAQIDQDK